MSTPAIGIDPTGAAAATGKAQADTERVSFTRAGWLRDLAALAIMAIGPLVLFRGSIFGSEIFYERDTYVFYYPLME